MSGPDLTYHLLFAVQGTADAVRQGRKDVTRRPGQERWVSLARRSMGAVLRA
jgi:hypothetical protein